MTTAACMMSIRCKDWFFIPTHTHTSFSSEITAECHQTYVERLRTFVESEQPVLKFPSSLTGSERKCVHQVCISHYDYRTTTYIYNT